jgi:hypothetical protein
METKGSRDGTMAVFNLEGQGCQRVVKPISKQVSKQKKKGNKE